MSDAKTNQNESSFIDDFILQSHSDKFGTSKYIKQFNKLDMKVSFGIGRKASIPWISFTAPGMSTSYGYYPVFLYFQSENLLVLSYGISETDEYDKTWPDEVFKKYSKIKDVIDKPKRYGESLVYKIYKVEVNKNVTYKNGGETYTIDNIINDLYSITNFYIDNLNYEIKSELTDNKKFNETLAYLLQGKNKSYSSTPLPVLTTIGKIKSGEIQIPEMQREYVWDTTKVRDLFDSLYRGYPIGYVLLWDVKEKSDQNRSIGTNLKSFEVSQYVIDGQQRLTSLYAVTTGEPVINSDFKEIKITIDFNPFTETFETSTPATEQDSEYFHDITGLFNISQQFQLINAFKENFELRNGRKLSSEENLQIDQTLSRVAGIMNVELQLLTLSDDMDIATASDVFVRINSKQADLSQADFILTLLSVRWAEGKREIQKFAKETKLQPENINDITAYNRLIDIDSSMMIYPISMLAFNRSVLRGVYPLLADDEDETNLNLWKIAHEKALNRSNWQSYINLVMSSGFIHDRMITQPNAFMFIYGIYLIGIDLSIDRRILERTISSFFFMSTLSRRYTSSSETRAQQDIQAIKDNIEKGISFQNTLEEFMQSSLTKDFFEIQLDSELNVSGAWGYSSWSCYVASQVVLNAPVLYTNMKISDLLDRERSGSRQLLELHHLFPKNYLTKELKLKGIRETNNRTNFQLITYKDNNEISDTAPNIYHKKYIKNVTNENVREMLRLNALWEGWDEEDYFDFLTKRRKQIINLIKEGWKIISENKIEISKQILDEKKHTIRPQDESTEDIVVKNKVESRNLELKETLIFDVDLEHNPSLKETINHEGIENRKNEILFSSLKNIAGFLNSEGGTLLIGVSDYWEIKGLDRDLNETKFENLDDIQHFITHKIESIFSNNLNKKDIDISFPEINGNTIARIDVEKSDEPIFVNKNGDEIFFVREIDGTKKYEAEKLAGYLISNFK
ncbi:DUF3578 domain-containing protein [Acidimicrobiaceae bacterium]|nr:DUF3578 domain-containing protein [Acidimicrobiaceae bacterium]